LSAYAQFKPLTLGIGICNQYAIGGGVRLALAISTKTEASISFGYGFVTEENMKPKSGTETTIGIVYYFKGINATVSFKDKKFDWPSGIALGGNYYSNKSVEKNYGLSMLFIYKCKPKHLLDYTNTPLYERRIGFGATYIIGKPTEMIVAPSLMVGADFRLPIKFKGYMI
jgi:hypothetical protein